MHVRRSLQLPPSTKSTRMDRVSDFPQVITGGVPVSHSVNRLHHLWGSGAVLLGEAKKALPALDLCQ